MPIHSDSIFNSAYKLFPYPALRTVSRSITIRFTVNFMCCAEIGFSNYQDPSIATTNCSRTNFWDIEICGIAQAPAHQHHGTFSTREDLDEFARKAGFPEHFLVVRPERDDDYRISKNLSAWQNLHQSFSWAKLQSSNGQVFVESDLRAHANPSRMQNICTATEDLIARIKSRCPSCAAPGFSVVERVAGLPRGSCEAPTRETRAEQLACRLCAHREVRNRVALKQADASLCHFCNP